METPFGMYLLRILLWRSFWALSYNGIYFPVAFLNLCGDFFQAFCDACSVDSLVVTDAFFLMTPEGELPED